MSKKRKVKAEKEQSSAWVAIPIVLLLLIGVSLIFIGVAGKDGSNQLLSKLKEGFGSFGSGIPEGKDAQFYFGLGLQYKNNGWVEKSRTVLKKAARMDPNGTAGHSAQVFMDVALPKKMTSEDAIMGNIDAYNLMVSSQNTAAVNKFRELIKEYPQFEWPYGNLGSMYLSDGRIDEAEVLIDKALQINPCYLNALRAKIVILSNLHKVKEEEEYIAKALDCLGSRERLEPAIAALYDEFAGMAPTAGAGQSGRGGRSSRSYGSGYR